MAFYRDKTTKISLVDKLIQKLTTAPSGSLVPYWTKIQSASYAQEGYVLYSKGSSGTDNIYIRISHNTLGLIMSMMETYTPNPVSGLVGTTVNESIKQNVSVSLSTYPDTAPVDYILSFDKDKIIFILKGNALAVSNSRQVLAYIGLPERLDPNDDSTATVFAVSRDAYQLTATAYSSEGPWSQCRVLRARNKDAQSIMNMVNLNKWKTKGWNGVVLLSHLYLQDDSNLEGVRSRMTSIHPIYQDTTYPDFRDGDEITVGSKRYIVVQVFDVSWGNIDSVNCFPTSFMAVEQL